MTDYAGDFIDPIGGQRIHVAPDASGIGLDLTLTLDRDGTTFESAAIPIGVETFWFESPLGDFADSSRKMRFFRDEAGAPRLLSSTSYPPFWSLPQGPPAE